MLKTNNLHIDLNSIREIKPTVFKVAAQTQLNLKVTGSFSGSKMYVYIFPVLLQGPLSAVNIEGKFFVSGSSQLKLMFSVNDTLKARAVSVSLNLKGLVFDKASRILVGQKISLSHKDSHLNHSLAFGSLSEEVLSYLNSRGVGNQWLKTYLEKNYVKI